MSIIHSVILGLVQGLTEFLPVSSSAHLNIFPWLFGWGKSPDSFDFALHVGTLFAILLFFWKDWIALIVGGWNQAFKKKKTTEGRMFWTIVFATIPAGILGAILENFADGLVKGNDNLEMGVIAAALILLGVILYLVDKNAASKLTAEQLKFKPAFLIGLSQAIAAALPGVSRSGITMTVARSYGVERESAARYSFLLSAPIVAGGALVKLLGIVENIGNPAAESLEVLPLLIGILASFLSGLVVIKFLLRYLKKGSYKAFAFYRVALGLVIFLLILIKLG